MICFRGRKNYQRTSENRRRAIKRSRESGFWLARYLLWSVYVFAEWSYIRDSASEKLEDRLGGGILITLYEKSEENRVQREAREETERKRIEEARKKKNFAKEKSRKFVVFMNL